MKSECVKEEEPVAMALHPTVAVENMEVKGEGYEELEGGEVCTGREEKERDPDSEQSSPSPDTSECHIIL